MLHRVLEKKASLRNVADDSGVSQETIRRVCMDDPHRQAVLVNTSLCKRAAISILASLRVYDARPFLDGRGCFCLFADQHLHHRDSTTQRGATPILVIENHDPFLRTSLETGLIGHVD